MILLDMPVETAILGSSGAAVPYQGHERRYFFGRFWKRAHGIPTGCEMPNGEFRSVSGLVQGVSIVYETVMETTIKESVLEGIRKKNILDRIKQGEWDCEPESVDDGLFDATIAMPGTNEKLSVLAARVEAGLPLWHGCDRTDYDEGE